MRARATSAGFVLVAVAVASALAAACSDDGGGGGGPITSCPNDLPPSCATTPPSYARDVQPIIQAHCVRCHDPNGENPSRPFDTYAQVYASRVDILNQVYSCSMPPATEPALSAAERHTLLQWLVCKAPNN